MNDPLTNFRLLGRIYFIAVIPFFGGAIAPWILGPSANAEFPIFLLWSFAVLLFCSAGWLGFSIGVSATKYTALHAFVGLAIGGAAVGALLAGLSQKSFLAAALLMFLHWLHLLWLQKTNVVDAQVLKQHQRFVWTVLACHMLVLLNMVHAAKTNP